MPELLQVGGAARLRRSEEIALNELLRRHGGDLNGRQVYRINWAAEDNQGLARNHSCGKTDPFDWAGCGCPRNDLSIPLCFHENQLSYHLLVFNPPRDVQSIVLYESQVKEDLTKGTYACLLHFVDPQGNAFNPTANIVEIMIPMLKQMQEISYAADRGYQATVEQLRKKREESELAERRKKAHEYDVFADALLDDATPAFGGNPMSGAGTKGRSTSDLLLSDIDRSK